MSSTKKISFLFLILFFSPMLMAKKTTKKVGKRRPASLDYEVIGSVYKTSYPMDLLTKSNCKANWQTPTIVVAGHIFSRCVMPIKMQNGDYAFKVETVNNLNWEKSYALKKFSAGSFNPNTTTSVRADSGKIEFIAPGNDTFADHEKIFDSLAKQFVEETKLELIYSSQQASVEAIGVRVRLKNPLINFSTDSCRPTEHAVSCRVMLNQTKKFKDIRLMVKDSSGNWSVSKAINASGGSHIDVHGNYLIVSSLLLTKEEAWPLIQKDLQPFDDGSLAIDATLSE